MQNEQYCYHKSVLLLRCKVIRCKVTNPKQNNLTTLIRMLQMFIKIKHQNYISFLDSTVRNTARININHKPNNITPIPRLKSNHKNIGFTLIELVVVIVILGILVATAAPKFMALKKMLLLPILPPLKGLLLVL